MSKEGEEFVLEGADSCDHEANELGRSAKFMAFLAARTAEAGRVSLAEVESRLATEHRERNASNEAGEPNHE